MTLNKMHFSDFGPKFEVSNKCKGFLNVIIIEFGDNVFGFAEKHDQNSIAVYLHVFI
jgi:hypothetical protein